MRIAQVSPLYESVPPRFYGGTERVVHYLTEELIRQGHDVTLFASGDSVTQGKLIPCSPRALRLDRSCTDPLSYHINMIDRVASLQDEFDLVHFHTEYIHFPIARQMNIPTLTTIHNRLDTPDHQSLYRNFSDLPLVSISNNHRKPVAFANFMGTIYHGLPLELLPFNKNPKKDYVAFLGRFSPTKGPIEAIDIAIRAGKKIKIAAKIDEYSPGYFEKVVEPRLNHPQVEYIGEIGEGQKAEFLGNAEALLFPINWPEPFGMVLIEALSCGTPVIAFNHGSVPEIIEHGKTGYIARDVGDAVNALLNVDQFSRLVCRRSFEKRFSVERMTNDYLTIYRDLMAQSDFKRPGISPAFSELLGVSKAKPVATTALM